MFIGYMSIISAYHPMKGLFQCPRVCLGGFFRVFPFFQVGLSVASPRFAADFTLQSLTRYVKMQEAPGKLPRRRLLYMLFQ